MIPHCLEEKGTKFDNGFIRSSYPKGSSKKSLSVSNFFDVREMKKFDIHNSLWI